MSRFGGKTPFFPLHSQRFQVGQVKPSASCVMSQKLKANFWPANRRFLKMASKKTIDSEKYMSDNYPMTWSAVKAGQRELWFDPRCWRNEDIKVFFQDLAYHSNGDFEKVIHKLPRSFVRMAAAEKRYRAWKREWDASHHKTSRGG